jgi:hypothetical protein
VTVKVHHRGSCKRRKSFKRPKPGGKRSYAQQTNAKDWWDSGRTYFIVKLNLGGTLASWTKGQTTHEGDDASGALQAIEAVGWRLDHIGYVYQPLKERAAPIVETVMAGNVVGHRDQQRCEVQYHLKQRRHGHERLHRHMWLPGGHL